MRCRGTSAVGSWQLADSSTRYTPPTRPRRGLSHSCSAQHKLRKQGKDVDADDGGAPQRWHSRVHDEWAQAKVRTPQPSSTKRLEDRFSFAVSQIRSHGEAPPLVDPGDGCGCTDGDGGTVRQEPQSRAQAPPGDAQHLRMPVSMAAIPKRDEISSLQVSTSEHPLRLRSRMMVIYRNLYAFIRPQPHMGVYARIEPHKLL